MTALNCDFNPFTLDKRTADRRSNLATPLPPSAATWSSSTGRTLHSSRASPQTSPSSLPKTPLQSFPKQPVNDTSFVSGNPFVRLPVHLPCQEAIFQLQDYWQTFEVRVLLVKFHKQSAVAYTSAPIEVCLGSHKCVFICLSFFFINRQSREIVQETWM